jgi:hypothetical protein
VRSRSNIEHSILLCVIDFFIHPRPLLRAERAARLKPPQSHSLFSRLAFDEGEHLLCDLGENDCTSQPDHDEGECVKRETEIDDEIVEGGWLEGDDIEDF